MDDRTDPDDLDTILSEQRRDLMAAKTLDSDLDMAFKLQMQEAMAASLALNPSLASGSSSRNSPPPSPPHDALNDAILDLAAALMLEDVERFAQEWEDHERTVSEMMKTKEDLNRRIHDQKFAADLRDVPEDYWDKHGDYYERPYCADESSSSSSTKAAAVETENLRLYCKGLVSEERVRDMKVVVAGAGIAICDPRDNLIFEARKNLEAVVDGVVLSNEASELEAIVEGLNKALTMDLKSVTFYCDDYMLYQYHVEVKFLNGMGAECPHEGCKNEVNIDSCAEFLAPKLVEAISQRIKESSIPVTDKVYCPNPRCSALMSKKEVLEYTKTTFVHAEQTGARRCMKCHYYFCINCKVPWHFNMTCYDYKRSHPYPHPEDQLLNSLATTKLWRQCVKCNHMVELAEGCYHITCRCGYEFCYTCGAEWKNKKATCSCRIWDERNIILEQP
ncbi:hypothetical protein L3X38_031295 [Prunus dulcis]|uniref:RBR-type E3 ubiquitin transferase n=1 Tax=Prunus dulcis TaxID=3755 RepID=A0AAD4YVG9_PRUDU|nr:hypothetical protein L3X38_031295 [Prunus dulcis]